MDESNKSLELATSEAYSMIASQTSVPKKKNLVNRAIHYVFDKDKPPFYHIVDDAFALATKGEYTSATKNASAKELSDQISSAKNSAAKWGGWCTAGLLTGLYGSLAVFAPEHYQSVGWAWDALAVTALTTGVWNTMLSDNYKNWKKDYQVYMSGMSSVVKVGYAVSVVDLAIKSFL